MKRFLFATFSIMASLGVFGLQTAQALEPPSDEKTAVVISGAEVTKNAFVSYTNVIIALDGRLGTPSLLLRGNVLHGDYDYTLNPMTGNEVDVDYIQGEMTLGYGGVYDGIWLAAYVGVDYQDHDLDQVDPTNSVQGSDVGFKVVGEVVKLGHHGIHYAAYGTYSTAFDSYYARLRVGRHIHDNLALGIEGVVLGDDEWDAERLGAYMQTHVDLSRIPLMRPGFLILSGGYQFSNDNGGRDEDAEGAYGTLQYKVLY